MNRCQTHKNQAETSSWLREELSHTTPPRLVRGESRRAAFSVCEWRLYPPTQTVSARLGNILNWPAVYSHHITGADARMVSHSGLCK